MIGLLIKNEEKVIAAITMSFYTFIHKKEKRDIINYISENDHQVLPGFFGYEIKFFSKNVEKNERIGSIFELFPGKTKCIYYLIDLLSNEKLSFLFDKL